MSQHNDPSRYEKQSGAQKQPLSPAQPTQPAEAPAEDFDHFPFLPIPEENPPQQETHKDEQTNPQDSVRRLRRLFGQALLTLALVVLAFWGGWFAHQYFSNQTFDASHPSRAYLQLIQQAWTDIDQHYVDRKGVDYKKMSYAAINAMVNTLGDSGHSYFLDPQNAQHQNQARSGGFTGIGLYFQQNSTTQQWFVSQPVPNGPADKAGLKPFDIVQSINGTDTTGKDPNTISQLIRGVVGTPITIVIQRPGESQTRTFIATVAEIELPNVIMYYIPKSHIAHIQVVVFASGVASDVRDAVNQAKALGATKFIIDLRNNSGGKVDEAINMSSLFLSGGNVLLEQDSSGQRKSVAAYGNPIDTTSPIVVLADRYTASAAEIVTGALKENNRAIVIGTKTYGTGTLLSPFMLADGSELDLGTQEWLTPDGHFIRQVPGDPNSGGITPNIQIDPNQSMLTANEEQQSQMNQQQILNSGDAQLVAAIQYLNQQK